jgi:hypothetical protein
VYVVSGKIQNRIKGGDVDSQRRNRNSSSSESEHNAYNVSHKMLLAKKHVHKEIFSEHHLRKQMEIRSRQCASTDIVEIQKTNQQQAPSIDLGNSLEIEVIKVLTPAKNMRKYLFVKELFSRSSAFVAFAVLKEKLMEFESDYALMAPLRDARQTAENDSFPHLPAEGCTLEDVGHYIDHCESQDPDAKTEEVNILVAATVDCVGYHSTFPCSLKSWAQEALEKVEQIILIFVYFYL